MAAPVALAIRVAATLDELKRNLAEGVSQIETTKGALQKMASSYDGSKIITQAGATAAAIHEIGGVTKLTADEQARANGIIEAGIEKYKALGKEVPPQLQQMADATKQVGAGAHGAIMEFVDGIPVIGQFIGAMSIERVAEFGVQLFETTAKFNAMSKATGASTDALQKMQYIAPDVGVEFESLVGGVQQLSDKLASGDQSAVRAVGMLGLSVKSLIASGPVEAMLQLSDAAGTIEDPMTKNTIASDLFGSKLGKQLIPALGDLRQKMNEVPKTAIISEENIKRADEFDAKLKQLTLHMKAFTVEAVSGTADFLKGLVMTGSISGALAEQLRAAATAEVKAAQDAAAANEQHAQSMKPVLTNAQLIANELRELREKAMTPLSAVQQQQIVDLQAWGKAEEEIAKDVQAPIEAVHRYIEAIKERKKTEEDAEAALMAMYQRREKAMITAAEATLQAYSFTGKVETLHSLIQAEEALARSVYNQLTSEKDRAKVVEELNLRRIELQNRLTEIELKQAKIVNDQVIAELAARKELFAMQGQNVDGTYGEMTASEKLQVALNELHNRKQEGISQYYQEQLLMQQFVKSLYDQAVAQDRATLGVKDNTEALMDNAKWIDQQVEKQRKLKQATDDTTAATTAAVSAMQNLSFAGTPRADKFKDWTTQQLISAGYVSGFDLSVTTQGAAQGLGYGPGGMPPGRASGGGVDAGSPYVVGERGPELFVPQSSGSIVPNGASGGVTIASGAIVINYPIMNDPRSAQMLSDIIINRLRSQGVRFPSTV